MILVLGNLYINNMYIEKFKMIDKDFIHIEKEEKNITQLISKSNYICACNFNLNKYINYLNSQQCIIMAETGIVNIDLEKAKEKNLNVYNLENYSCDAVVQYIMYCIINELRQWDLIFSKKINKNNIISSISKGIENLTIGIVGLGNIGKQVLKILNEFNCKVLYTNRRDFSKNGVKNYYTNELFRKSDFIIVCCSLNKSSYKMIDENFLRLLKPYSTIVSISQISVFNGVDLNKFLKNRPDVKAYLDVDLNEFVENLNNLPNVFISPHVAFYTQQTIFNRTDACIKKIVDHVNLHKKSNHILN